MGTCCSKNSDGKSQYPGREDSVGKRRLSAYALGIGGNHNHDIPPTVECSLTHTNTQYNFTMDVFCKSLAGTYAPSSYKDNQDDYLAQAPFFEDSSLSIFGVFDGHGAFGGLSSRFVNKSVVSRLKTLDYLRTDEPRALADAFSYAHADVLKSTIDSSCSGTTAVACLVHDDKLFVANAGDSRCVLGYLDAKGKIKAKDLSHDHKPDNPEEKKRIERSGGRVDTIRGPNNEQLGPYRVWLGQEMYPGLAMSRSIGDSIAHAAGCSEEAEVEVHSLNLSTDKFMIIASDGVWEFISSTEAVIIVSTQNTPQLAAEQLCQEALKRWRAEEQVCDDITAVIVFFHKKEEEAAKAAE